MENNKTQKELIAKLKNVIKAQTEIQKKEKPFIKNSRRQIDLHLKEINCHWTECWKETVKFCKENNIPTTPEYCLLENKYRNRIHLLAYGLLRGVPYAKIENKINPNEESYITRGRAKHVYAIYEAHFADDNRFKKLTEQDIYDAFCGGNHG